MEKKKLIRAVSIVVIVTVLGGGSCVGVRKWSGMNNVDAENEQENFPQNVSGNLGMGNWITASGITSAGTKYYYFPLVLDGVTPIEIEAVYVKAGEKVTTGAALYAITEESYQMVMQELEEGEKSAESEYTQAKIDYETDLLELESNYQTNQGLNTTAKETYENTIASLSQAVELAKEELESTKTVIATYPAKILKLETKLQTDKNSLTSLKKEMEKSKKDYEKIEKSYEKAKAAYEAADAKYTEIQKIFSYVTQYQKGTTSSDEKISNEQNPPGARKQQSTGGATENASLQGLSEKIAKELKTAETTLQKARKAYETAQEKYETKKSAYETKKTKVSALEDKIDTQTQQLSNDKEELAEAKENSSAREVSYQIAVSQQTTESITAKEAYEQDMLTYRGAKTLYEKNKKELKHTLATVKEKYLTAKEQLNGFKEIVVNGKIYANCSQTIASVTYAQGDYLNTQIPMISYADSDSLDVIVTIDQSQIASIAVGDTVNVLISDSNQQGLEATVSKIETTKAESSASKVNYSVTVSIDNQDGSLSSGSTAQVMFISKTNLDVKK